MGSRKPLEIKVQLTEKCNYNCSFCFNKQSLATDPKSLPIASAEKIVLAIADEGIEKIRFTGGEPLLYPGLMKLLLLAKKKGLSITLNTNASLLSKENAKEIGNIADNVLVSMHSLNQIPNFSSAANKLAQGNCLAKAATILSKENILVLEKFHQAISALSFSQWVLLRQIPNALNKCPVSGNDMRVAVEKIELLNVSRKKRNHFLIENALPFCCFEPDRVNAVALGGIHEDGHSGLFVDVNATIKPSYFFDIKLGNATKNSFLDAWKSGFMLRMNALEFTPEICHNCKYALKCMSGSRFSAFLINKSLYALDPLANHLFFPKTLSEINK